MKILVPTDFGIYSDYAKDLAKEIIKIMGGEIHFYHAAGIPDDWEDLPADVRYRDTFNKDIAITVRNKLDELVQECESEDIKAYGHYTGGVFDDNIVEIIEAETFDLVVMGSHGALAKEERRFGTHTQKVIRKFHVPLLAVKRPISKINFKKVVFATDLKVQDQSAFLKFLELIRPFKPKEVHILTVNTGSFFSQPTILIQDTFESFKKLAADFECKAHFYADYSVEAGIHHFVLENNIDLVGISNLVRHPIKRIFQGSNVETIVNRSTVPVLTIDY